MSKFALINGRIYKFIGDDSVVPEIPSIDRRDSRCVLTQMPDNNHVITIDVNNASDLDNSSYVNEIKSGIEEHAISTVGLVNSEIRVEMRYSILNQDGKVIDSGMRNRVSDLKNVMEFHGVNSSNNLTYNHITKCSATIVTPAITPKVDMGITKWCENEKYVVRIESMRILISSGEKRVSQEYLSKAQCGVKWKKDSPTMREIEEKKEICIYDSSERWSNYIYQNEIDNIRSLTVKFTLYTNLFADVYDDMEIMNLINKNKKNNESYKIRIKSIEEYNTGTKMMVSQGPSRVIYGLTYEAPQDISVYSINSRHIFEHIIVNGRCFHLWKPDKNITSAIKDTKIFNWGKNFQFIITKYRNEKTTTLTIRIKKVVMDYTISIYTDVKSRGCMYRGRHDMIIDVDNIDLPGEDPIGDDDPNDVDPDTPITPPDSSEPEDPINPPEGTETPGDPDNPDPNTPDVPPDEGDDVDNSDPSDPENTDNAGDGESTGETDETGETPDEDDLLNKEGDNDLPPDENA